MPSNDILMLQVDTTKFLNSEWQLAQKSTELWIEEMERIALIERHFGIKLKLPKKATEDEHIAVEILVDSIKKKPCVTLPALPFERKFLTRRYLIDEEIPLELETLPRLEMFGYVFNPIRKYIVPCCIIWNKRLEAWETVDGGIPARVEFEAVSKGDL